MQCWVTYLRKCLILEWLNVLQLYDCYHGKVPRLYIGFFQVLLLAEFQKLMGQLQFTTHKGIPKDFPKKHYGHDIDYRKQLTQPVVLLFDTRSFYVTLTVLVLWIWYGILISWYAEHSCLCSPFF